MFHIVAAQEYYLKSGRQQILYDKAMPNAPTCLVASNLPVGHICPAQLDCMPAAIYTAVPRAPEISTSLSFFHRVLLTQNLISSGASSGLTRYFVVNIKMDNLCSAAGIQIVDTSCYSNNDLIQLVQMKLFSLNKINDAPKCVQI